MKSRNLTIIWLTVLQLSGLLQPGLFINIAQAQTQGPALVSVWSDAYGSWDITDTGITPGTRLSIQIRVDNAPPFNAYDFRLFYDPKFLEALSANVRSGTIFNNPFVAVQEFSPGTVRLAVVNLGSDFTLGSGTMAHVNFNVTGVGVSPLTLAAGTGRPSGFAQSFTVLALRDSFIPVTTSDGYFRNEGLRVGPVADFTFSPTFPSLGELLTFNASASSDPDNDSGPTRGIRWYFWDFGDGAAAGNLTRPTVTHFFGPITGMPYSGNFSVRLTVVDDDGFQGMTAKRIGILSPRYSCPEGLRLIKVPRDCTALFAAVESVAPGGTVEVDPGTYLGYLLVRKPVTLRGSGAGLTVVQGPVSVIGAIGVVISGFTFQGGVEVNKSTGVVLQSNRIENAMVGITLSSSSEVVLRNNVLRNNTFSFGIAGSTVEDYAHDIDASNLVDGKPVYYLLHASGVQVPLDAGYVGLVNSTIVSVGPISTGRVSGVLVAFSSDVTLIGFGLSQGIVITNSTKVTMEGLDISVAGNPITLTVGVDIVQSSEITIRHSSIGGLCDVGLSLANSSRNRVLGNRIACWFGIQVRDSHENEFTGNLLDGPGTIGIWAVNSHGNLFQENHIQDYSSAVGTDYSSNTFAGNTIDWSPGPLASGRWGFSFYNSPGNVLRDNRVLRAFSGLTVQSSHPTCVFGIEPCHRLEEYVQDIDSSNTLNGKPVFYLVNQQGKSIPSTAGFIAIVNSSGIAVRDAVLSFTGDGLNIIASSNVLIQNVNLTFVRNGIWSWSSTGLTIRGNEISYVDWPRRKAHSLLDWSRSAIVIENSHGGSIVGNSVRPIMGHSGIVLSNSTGFRIEGNYVSQYEFRGIQLISSPGNTLSRNTVTSGWEYSSYTAIFVEGSSHNLIAGNTIVGNFLGLVPGDRNTIHHNNFFDNIEHAVPGSGNVWDDGAGEGNFWSDYAGKDLDGDGVGDTLLPHLGVDSYPLLRPWVPEELSADFSGQGLWPESRRFSLSKDNDGTQSLFARVANTGAAAGWVQVLFNITSNRGTTTSLVTHPVWLEPGEAKILTTGFQPSSGVYSVIVQVRISSDAFQVWSGERTRRIHFIAVP